MRLKELRRVFEGLRQNLSHQPAVPWRSIRNAYGLPLKPILNPNVGGQLAGLSAIAYLPYKKTSALRPLSNADFLLGNEVHNPQDVLNTLLLESTLDHEATHFSQVFSDLGLKEYERIEMRNLILRFLRRGDHLREVKEAIFPLPLNTNIWTMEASPIVAQYLYLSNPFAVEITERLKSTFGFLRETDDLKSVKSLATPNIGNILIEALKYSQNHILAWNFMITCEHLVAPKFRSRLQTRYFTALIVEQLVRYKSLNPENIVKILNNLDSRIVQMKVAELLKHVGIDFPKWKESLANELNRFSNHCKKFGFDGPIERSTLLAQLLGAIPLEDDLKSAPYIIALAHCSIIISGSSCLINAKPCAKRDYVKIVVGGFIDTYLADQVAKNEQLECPFAHSPQNLFGCLDCSGLIDGKGLNNNCPNAKRWLS